ncbi:hypothetical protein AVEN_184380-1 [Araneus ventricosus]|uniref:Uncharacterized protein n=1 Tax=Araneus ventricosus TaxID=182803 RepID=A0A4Y2BFD8_ARAVE|nr:hypothetical protein AVEN_184380-1 [Araneus ventricosus]
MMRATSELASRLQNSTPHQQEALAPYVLFNVLQVHIHSGSSAESGFEPGTQARDLTTATFRCQGQTPRSSPPTLFYACHTFD